LFFAVAVAAAATNCESLLNARKEGGREGGRMDADDAFSSF
jgi:hypothetical protein